MDLVDEWVTSMPAGNTLLVKPERTAHFAYAERPEIAWSAVENFLSGALRNP
jgi:hypothetical protein